MGVGMAKYISPSQLERNHGPENHGYGIPYHLSGFDFPTNEAACFAVPTSTTWASIVGRVINVGHSLWRITIIVGTTVSLDDLNRRCM